jgi:hypothetical protein
MKSRVSIVGSMVLVQVCLFSLLNAIWGLGNTILLRNLSLGLGAVISIFIVYQARKILITKKSYPILLICLLLLWMLIHLEYFSINHLIQLQEFYSVWKRVLLSAIFGLGFGIGIRDLYLKNQNKILMCTKNIFYLGLISPTLIYIVKYLLVQNGDFYGMEIPAFLKLYKESAPFYTPKTVYMCFCAPIFLVLLMLIIRNLRVGKILCISNFIHLLIAKCYHICFI